jgi:antitoxin component of MazEF toxin-antitoxin module
MSKPMREVYTARYYRAGCSYGIILPPDVREAMGLRPGDYLALNFQHGVLWAVKMTASMIVSREQVAKVYEHLYPAKEPKIASE